MNLLFRLSVTISLFALIDCRDIALTQPERQQTTYHPPLSTTEYLRQKQTIGVATEQGQRNVTVCNNTPAYVNAFIDTLRYHLTLDYGAYQASYYCDTLLTYRDYLGFFAEAPVVTISPHFPSVTDKAIDWAMEQQPRPQTLGDSAARVVNYVFTQYSYGAGSLYSPQSFQTAPMNQIGAEITANRLAGLCGDLTNFLGLIISTKYPWWGTPVSLSTQPTGTIGHTFLGLADAHSNIYMVLDPTVNTIWSDADGNPISLELIQQLLLEEPQKVSELKSVVFGTMQKQFSQSPCLLYTDIIPGSASAVYEPQTQYYAIQANWYGFSDTTSLNYRALVAPYWALRHMPGNTWANQCLIIDYVSCSNSQLQQAILQRYGSYAARKGF